MTLHYDLYWSFRSPYSYFVTPRLLELGRDYDVICHVRPVYPLAIRKPEFFANRDALWPGYFRLDTIRAAEFAGLSYSWPMPDPVQSNPETKQYLPLAEQPYIQRLTRLGAAAAERGDALPFLRQISHLIWSGEVSGWDQGTHLAEAAKRAGFDLAELDAAIEAAPETYEAVIEKNQIAQREAGHWGVPLMVFDGEPFFGQDRFLELKWRLGQKGLQKR